MSNNGSEFDATNSSTNKMLAVMSKGEKSGSADTVSDSNAIDSSAPVLQPNAPTNKMQHVLSNILGMNASHDLSPMDKG